MQLYHTKRFSCFGVNKVYYNINDMYSNIVACPNFSKRLFKMSNLYYLF